MSPRPLFAAALVALLHIGCGGAPTDAPPPANANANANADADALSRPSRYPPPVFRLDERSSPELYVRELLARFSEEAPDRADDLAAFAESFADGQLEDAVIELLALSPDESLAALLAWRADQARTVGASVARRRLDTLRRLAALADREFTDAALIAFVKERHGGTLADMLTEALRVDAPS